MTLTLSNLKNNKQNKNRKRVGRGNASGHGTYSTRGLKGQKSRSGVSGLKRLGMKKQLLAIPKKRGFRSYQPKVQVVLFKDLNANFKDGAVINFRALIQAGLAKGAKNAGNRVKVLSQGELKLKNVTFVKIMASAEAKKKIEAAGGIFKN